MLRIDFTGFMVLLFIIFVVTWIAASNMPFEWSTSGMGFGIATGVLLVILVPRLMFAKIKEED